MFHDLEGLVRDWEQRPDQRSTAVVHVGFERSPARHFESAIAEFPGQVLLTPGAKYSLPKGYEATSDPVAVCEAGDLFLAIQGWGYEASNYQTLKTDRPVAAPRFEDWLPAFIGRRPEAETALASAGIHDDAAYLIHESSLPRELRLDAGLFRFRVLNQSPDDPCEIALAAPPWLRQRSFDDIPLTTRLTNVFTSLRIEFVSDLDPFTTLKLLKTPNFGRKSITDLAEILTSALAAGPLDRKGALNAVQEVGLITAVRRSLLNFGKRERDVLTRRMGLEAPPETLHEIGLRYGVTRERVRQIELMTVRRLLATALWDDLLTKKLRGLLARREYPVPLRGIEAVDSWFKGVGDRPDVVRYLLATVSEAGAALVEVDGIEYFAFINQDRWDATLVEAKRLLMGGVNHSWSEGRCRQLVEGLLPEQAREFRSLLWAKASQMCHFVENGGERYLRQYGRGAEQFVEVVLEESEHPLHFTEIAARAGARAGRLIDERRAHSAAATVGLLLGRGTYGVVKHLPLTREQMEHVAECAEDIVADGSADRQWHCAGLVFAVADRQETPQGLDKYILDIALRSSGNLRRHGRMVWSQHGDGEAVRIDIRQAITSLLKASGRPLRASDIRQRLIAVRGLGQHFQIQQVDPLIRVGPAVWGLNDRDVEIKREDQPRLANDLVALLTYRGIGLHITELREAFNFSQSMHPDAVFALATLDDRLRVNVGQYLFLRSWGDPRRMTIQDAVRAVLAESSDFLSFEAIVLEMEARLGRRCGRNAIFASLKAVDAEFDGRGMWRRAVPADDEEEEPKFSSQDLEGEDAVCSVTATHLGS